MFDEVSLGAAVTVQNRTYNLLRWVESAVDRNLVSADAAHKNLSDAEAVGHWLRSCYERLPSELRPASDRDADLIPFANFLSSYLRSSFEFEENPGQDRRPYGICPCPMCSYLVDRPHLRRLRPTEREKKRARELQVEYLRDLAADGGTSLSQDEANKLLDCTETRQAAAMATYGRQLIERMNGSRVGPEILVLWRRFAWTESGAPKRSFKLSASDILDSERRLISQIRQINE